jgi:nicotinate-nucleotide adenylyltransferase
MGLLTPPRIGILGGTFDPIHYGHLAIAEDVWAALHLDEVLLVPAGEPPHKRGRPISPVADRVAMVEAAIADNPHFRLSRVEVDRPGPSYSVDTVGLLRQQLGPEAQLFFIVGGDALADLPSWREPAVLAERCQIVAVHRPGWQPGDLAPLEAAIPGACQRIIHLPVVQLDLAASDIRRRVATDQPITYLVPPAVRRYIESHHLYRPVTGPPALAGGGKLPV